MHRDIIKRKLIKLLALARAGEGGERENARTLLERLMHKYQFELTDLECGSERITYTLAYHTEWEKRLLGQIMYRVMNDERKVFLARQNGQIAPYLCADLEPAEHAEIEMTFGAYRRQLEKEFERLFTAFLSKHELFVASTDAIPPEPPLSKEDLAAITTMIAALDTVFVWPELQVVNGSSGV
jgi:hypothetical protein